MRKTSLIFLLEEENTDVTLLQATAIFIFVTKTTLNAIRSSTWNFASQVTIAMGAVDKRMVPTATFLERSNPRESARLEEPDLLSSNIPCHLDT